jgi:putative glutamine amidotransferase
MDRPSRRQVISSALLLATGLAGFFFGISVRTPAVFPSREAPLIGIASLSSESYIRAVRESGGIPVVLPNTDGSVDQVDKYLSILDGLLLPGGADIPPSEYGDETVHETVKLLEPDRFQFEKALSRAWIEKTDKPLLGICLGSQWINVSSGGTLVQDIPSEFGVVHRDTNHSIAIEPDSRLGQIYGQTTLEVNSFHHQAVRDIGKNLRVVAKSPDGIVEATESSDPDRFLIGVQWHPEKMMPEDALQSKLIRAFIEAAKRP